MTESVDVVVVGGGVCGLACAYTFQTLQPSLKFALFEASDRFGGPLKTEHAEGFLLEHGPDGFVRSKPAAEQLIRSMGLGDELIETQPQFRGVHVLRDGALHRVPEGVFLVAPTAVRAWLRSPIATLRGRLRALAEIVIPPGESAENESIDAFVTRRFGAEVSRLFASSILAGIHSGDPAKLSIVATFPQLVKLEREHRSIILGLRARARKSPPRSGPTSAFYSLRRGMGTLIDELAQALGSERCHSRSEVTKIEQDAKRWTVYFRDRAAISARAVVLAVPPRVAATLLAEHLPAQARELSVRESSSSVIALLGYHQKQISSPLGTTGFVVAGGEDFPITACTVLSDKWPGRAPPGHVLLRAFMGGFRQPTALEWSDGAVLERAERAFSTTLGVHGSPVISRIVRYVDHSPQLLVGHVQRQRELEQALLQIPPLAVVGTGYDGVGIPDAIRQGVEGANVLHQRLLSNCRD